MTTPLTLELKGDCFFIDNSTLSDISACARKGAYSALLRLREVKPRAALFFGGAIHKALEIRDLEQQILCTSRIQEKMVDALVTYYDDADCGEDYRNLSYAIRTIERYNKSWPADPQVAIELPDGTVAVELPFALPLATIDINAPMWVHDPDVNNGAPEFRHIDTITLVFTGKIDRVCVKNGLTYLLDHKTTSMGGPTFFDEFFISHQFRGYKWAAEQLLGTKIAGVIINALICRPPLKSGDTNYTFDRQEVLIADDQVTDWQHSFVALVETFLSYHLAQDLAAEIPQSNYPMSTGACVTKYGKCEFFQVCQLRPRHRHAILTSRLYENNTWSPLEDHAKPKKEKSSFSMHDLFNH